LLVDCHAHVLPDAALARFPNGASPRYVTAERTVLGRMLEAQEQAGISHALVSDSFYVESAREELPEWSPTDRVKLYNDALAELVGRYPGRLFGLGCIDAWEGEAAARELERLPGLGLVGALVNPSDGRRYLDDPAAQPLLATAERLGLTLFLHPTRDLPAPEHWSEFVMHLTIGRPAQTAVNAARLIFSGTLDRYPRLQLLLAHGGGVLPYVAGRIDATWSAYRPNRWEGPDLLEHSPASYLRRFYCDSNTWSTPALRLIVDLLGADRLVFGTDQPPVWAPLDRSVAALDGLHLAPAVREAVHWRTAARLFSVPLVPPPPAPALYCGA
jgi:predicted TIM-barrel fold metal-dependent hydrolase